ncbi:ATP-binding protein [Aquabacterium sp.]|uniref:sensor histidine kinase n=1 Tax=Aquabacterium sp. TaxID=1872578 RepID=UPI0025BFD050|nr:ATP-binding protein [Aquabacterium sp.]
MRSDVDFSTPLESGFRQSKTWFWRWALGGMAMVLVLALIGAPIWVFALAVITWCIAGAVWFQSDAVAILRQISDANVNSTQANECLAWQNWISGWYWETDARGQLQVFKQGGVLPQGISINWMELSEYVRQYPALLSWWGVDDDAQADSGRLAYCLDQKVAWGGVLSLPWPKGLRGVSVDGAGWRCAMSGEPRWDARGGFLGFRGVMQMLAPVPACAAASEASLALSKAEADLAAQNAQMREAEQEVLRYALSHDLRAPLRVVEGFTRIVKEDYGSAMDKLGNDHLERVLTAAARMNGMIDAILAQAQLAAEPLQRVAIDLSALARDIGAEQCPAASVNGRALAQLIVADGLTVEADPVLVHRVMENLISNALKYSGKVEAPRVEVGVMPATNPAVFYVRDNGAGFDMQHADKLFGMFQRLHSAKEFPGTGVGLAGVQNIVRRHGGRIWAEAKLGEGACFYFTLMDTVEAQQRASRSS